MISAVPLVLSKFSLKSAVRRQLNLVTRKFSTMSFSAEKEKYLKMSFEEKKALLKSKKIVTLADIDTWDVYFSKNSDQLEKQLDARLKNDDLNVGEFAADPGLAKRVSIFEGDITALYVDAIVNAANSRLLGGGGVDGAIHNAAGGKLLDECRTLNGCQTGDAKITGGYKLPAKYVIHTVGPQDGSEEDLKSCYEKSLQLCVENDVHSVAFPCVSTGVYGFPHELASIVATTTVREFLEKNTSVDVEIYKNVMQKVFPVK